MNKAVILRKLKKAAPIVLSILSGVGVVATAVLSSKATAKALDAIDKKKTEEELEPKEVVETVWKYYIPTAVVAFATIGCIVGNGVLNKKEQSAIMASCALLGSKLKAYQDKVKEVCGEEAHKDVISSLAMVERAKNPDILCESRLRLTSLDWGGDEEEEHHLFYEVFTGKYFTSTMSRVLQAEAYVNRNIALGGFVTINDFFRFNGVDEITGGDEIGWMACDGYLFVDFDHYKLTLEDLPDGLEAYAIEPVWIPMRPDEIDDLVY